MQEKPLRTQNIILVNKKQLEACKMLDILIAGELNVDVFMSGLRQAPEFGREILADGYQELAGSSTGNTICTAASLGLKTAVFGRLGRDRFGETMLKALQRYGVETGFLDISDTYQTGVTVSMSNDRDRAMVTYFGDTINAFEAGEIPVEAAKPRHVHMPSFYLNPRVQPGLAGVYAKAHEMGITTSLDAGWDESGRWHDHLDEVLRHTDFFFPNESETEAITGESDPVKGAIALAAMGCNVVVKCGGDGSYYCAKNSTDVQHFPGYPTRLVETTGAGDSFDAGFLYAYLNGRDIPDCMRMGNAVGALSVQRNGGVENCPTLAEALRTIEHGTAL